MQQQSCQDILIGSDFNPSTKAVLFDIGLTQLHVIKSWMKFDFRVFGIVYNVKLLSIPCCNIVFFVMTVIGLIG
tara:strand:+ start:1778 stop:1999 length:222 start_codon:yes stop_codon:yes gene_type:complete